MGIEELVKQGYQNIFLANKTQGYERNAHLEVALFDFSKAIELDPENADLYNHRGYAFFNLERLKEAEEDVTEAMRLDPNNAQAYLGRGRIYNHMGKFAEAIKDLSKVRDLDSQFIINVHVHIGDSMNGLGNIAEAKENYEQVLQLLEVEHIGRWKERDYSLAISAQKGLQFLDQKLEFKLDYEKEAINRRVMTQLQVDNMKKPQYF